MLRWSAEAYGYRLDLRAVADPSIHAGVPGARALVGLVDANLLGDESAREKARHEAIDELGAEGFVDAAAVIGNFEMMNRVAEGTGIPIAPQALEREAEMMQTLGLYDLLKSHHR